MFIPINRYLLVEPVTEDEESKSPILLPESPTKSLSPHSVVKLLAVSPDCEKFNGEVGHVLVVNSNMIENIKVGNDEYKVVLENHVVGLISGE
jgi:co-chaperonin GroES (HSP10)